MPLQPEEIVRFSRQILLPQVGGRGQERLLAARFGVEGRGAALEAARDYLEAGGCVFSPSGEGGLLGDPSCRKRGRPQIVLGGHRQAGVVLWLDASGCRACFEATRETLGPLEDDASSVSHGALAALIFQRVVWGAQEELGAIAFSVADGLSSFELLGCGEHPSS